MKSLLEIESEFRNSISIPHKKPEKQIFFCPTGLVGAGKTTVTKPISKKLGLIRLSSDELRKILKENGHNYDSVKEIGLRIAKDLAKQGYSIAFDMDCGNPEVISFVETLQKKCNTKVFWVHVTAPEEYIFNKFQSHPPSWLADNPKTMIDNYLAQKQKRLEENNRLNFDYEFDTSRTDIQDQINECIGLIKNK